MRVVQERITESSPATAQTPTITHSHRASGDGEEGKQGTSLCADMPVGSGRELEELSRTASTRVGTGEAALPRM